MSTKKDADDLREYLKDKDTSKMTFAINQTLDNINAKSAWLEVRNQSSSFDHFPWFTYMCYYQRSKGDVKAWLEDWKKVNKIEQSV